MQLMIIQKNDPKTEADLMPTPEVLDGARALFAELHQQGRLLGAEGLCGSASRTRLVFRDGRCTKKDGPYAGERELPGAILHLQVATREQAIGWAERYGQILGTGELELGKIREPWDVGLVPMPENPPLQFLLIDKADSASEAGGRSSKQKAELTRLKTEMTKAGVLQKAFSLAPSATAKRLVIDPKALRLLDGPFSESKELVGGFLLLELEGLDEAIAFCRRYVKVLDMPLEIDIRLLAAEEGEAP